ncbi:class I SAM-dependent methyltransferase [Streptomyces sp. NPDC092296]|uniref:class I SAM-dependent methyltransferase n=1 Tax=Streptomyces sp. NPDC092296 TaxID=3366012 RepID=UPI0037FDB53F
MTTEQRDDVERGRVFGEVAEVYDAARPGYPDDLVSEVLGYAALGDRPAVEVGAGTGKATVAFAARGVPLVCVEPDPQMAAVLRRNTAAYADVRIDVGGFEEWQPGGRRYGLLIAASSWHWVDQARRWDLAYGALAPGGAMALAWHVYGVHDTALHSALAEVDTRYGMVHTPHSDPLAAYDDESAAWTEQAGRPEPECRRDGRFTDLRSIRFRQEHRYSADAYRDHLLSVSAYRILPDHRREQVLTEVARTLEAHGGGITVDRVTDLFLARAR